MAISQSFISYRPLVLTLTFSIASYQFEGNPQQDLELLKRFALSYFSILKTYNADFEIFLKSCEGFLRVGQILRRIVRQDLPQLVHLFSTLASFAISEDVEGISKAVTVLLGGQSSTLPDEPTQLSISENSQRNVHFILSLLVTTNVQEILLVKLCELVDICSKSDASSTSQERNSLETHMELILDLFLEILDIEKGKVIFPQMLKQAKQKVGVSFDFDQSLEYLLNETSNINLTLKVLSMLTLLESSLNGDQRESLYSKGLKNSLVRLVERTPQIQEVMDKNVQDKISLLLSVLPVEEFLFSE